MRIISGRKRGIRLATFKHRAIRPTADSTKEAIFNVLRDYVEGCIILDIFAGTGSLGIEALSRGAAKAIFIENDWKARNLIEQNLRKCCFTDQAEILPMSAARGIRKLSFLNIKFDLVFADPPYAAGKLAVQTLTSLDRHDLLARGGWLVLEHSFNAIQANSTDKYVLKARKRWGESEVSFYQYE